MTEPPLNPLTTLPLNAHIAVGFGVAAVTRNGIPVWQEEPNMEFADTLTCEQAEEMAVADPDADWRIHMIGPLKETYWQRQGPGMWVLYKKGQGFA
jgi:hypothetical protein